MVRELLKIHFPERMGYLMTAQEAWHLLMTTPRLYKDETTFTDSTGTLSVPCHLHRQIERTVVAK